MKNQNSNLLSRRNFMSKTILSSIAISAVGLFGSQIFALKNNKNIRKYHISMQSEAWEENPELLDIMEDAGITDIWMAAYLQGKWYKTPEELERISTFLITKGFNPHMLTVPLGHPGNAIDPTDPSWSEKKKSWRNAQDFDGKLYSGTSIHKEVIKDNIEVHQILKQKGFDVLFLDDDFRLAKSPGKIGGCFCNECKEEFLTEYRYEPSDWDALIDAVNNRNNNKILRSWIDFICDKEYNMFKILQQTAPKMELGIMVMYLGAEKAGIALDKYQDVPFRVGELMFNDKSFSRIKGKTDELFSSLFHKRFIKPELAFSETTAYPQNKLSAKNMAAKLNVSLISDVRNTMFMSGLKPFPFEHWNTLAPAMKKSAKLHKKIAGFTPKGPFKHFWGWESRLVGKDKPFSLFLASGIPFEVIDDISDDGWIFLSNEDAESIHKGNVTTTNNNLVTRKETNITGDSFIQLEETLEDLYKLKEKVIPTLKGIPYVVENSPVVFSWYPSANKGLLWNLSEDEQTFTIKIDGKTNQTTTIKGLDIKLVPNLAK